MAKKRLLGDDPLETVSPASQSIFARTDDSGNQNLESSNNGQETRNQKPESGFLSKAKTLDNVSIRLPAELNDYVTQVINNRRRNKLERISKERIFQAAIELLREVVNLEEVATEDELRQSLLILVSRIQNPE